MKTEGKFTIVFLNQEDANNFVKTLKKKWLKSYHNLISQNDNTVLVSSSWEEVQELWDVIIGYEVDAGHTLLKYLYERDV